MHSDSGDVVDFGGGFLSIDSYKVQPADKLLYVEVYYLAEAGGVFELFAFVVSAYQIFGTVRV